MTHTQATDFEVNNTTTTIVSTPGFWRLIATISTRTQTSVNNQGNININDGFTTKTLVELKVDAVSTGDTTSQTYDIVVCLSAGEFLRATSNELTCFVTGSVRQIADLNGTLIDPTGFAPQ